MVLGLLLSILSGLLDGTTAAPMHFIKKWKVENVWVAFCLFEMLVLPWVVGYFLLEDPFAVYSAVPQATLVLVVLLGAGFGLGNFLFGLGVARVGLGLGNAIAVSVIAVNGALVPLIILHRDQLATPAANFIYAALVLLVIGIVLCSLAARGRSEEKALLAREKPSLVSGIIILLLCGIFSPCVNFAFAFGQPVTDAALATGANAVGGSVAVLIPMFAGAFALTIVVCAVMLTRNRTWKDFVAPGTGSHWFYGFLMGVCNNGAFLVYGVAAGVIGPMGPVIGFPVYMASIILTSNVWAWLRGEWRGSEPRVYAQLFSGIALIVLAIFLVSRAQF